MKWVALRAQAQLQNGQIKIHAAGWPAFTYPGDPPGKDFNIDDVQEGFLRGHLLKRVFRHIFTSPSSALIDDGELTITRSGNAKLHNMYKVEAENIAYAFIQSRFAISSRDKWHEKDGNYSYRDAYYRTIRAIREPYDPVWSEELLEWWNKAVFGNKRGVPVFNISEDEEEDDLVLMRKQFAMRAAASAASLAPPPDEATPPTPADPPTPASSTLPPATDPPTPASSTPPPATDPPTPASSTPPPATDHSTPVTTGSVPPAADKITVAPKPRPIRAGIPQPLPLQQPEEVPLPPVHQSPPIPSPGTASIPTKDAATNKRKSTVLEVDDDSELTEDEPDSPIPSKRVKKGRKKATTTASKKRKGRK